MIKFYNSINHVAGGIDEKFCQNSLREASVVRQLGDPNLQLLVIQEYLGLHSFRGCMQQKSCVPALSSESAVALVNLASTGTVSKTVHVLSPTLVKKWSTNPHCWAWAGLVSVTIHVRYGPGNARHTAASTVLWDLSPHQHEGSTRCIRTVYSTDVLDRQDFHTFCPQRVPQRKFQKPPPHPHGEKPNGRLITAVGRANLS